MDKELTALVKKVQEKYAGRLESQHGEDTLVLQPDKLAPAVMELRDACGFNLLVDITAVDDYPREQARFQLVVQLLRLKDQAMLRLRVPLNGNAPSLPTLTAVYVNANWYEREVWDMFGIRFEGHPDLRRIVLPYEWQGHPLRKDYPLGYEEVQYSFNYNEIKLRKPHPKE
jgi:NADH-quinone oxidoreductase subunit C